MRHYDPFQELLEAYALGALEDAERARVDTHLLTCESCRDLVSEYAEVAAGLPHALASATGIDVPPEVKKRLLQMLSVERASARPVKTWFNWRPRLATGGLALLLALSLAWGFRLNVALAQERALRSEFASLVDQQELVLEVVDSGKTTRAFLRATSSESNSYGKLFTRSDFPEVVAMTGRLPAPPAGLAYHLWVTRGGESRLAGIININEKGFGLLVFSADRPGPLYESAQVILQPIGSTSPGGPTILAWHAEP